MQQKVRINDLARELEVKSKVILDLLLKVGVTEKKTHSSSIEVDEAERVKKYYAEHGEPGSTSSRTSRPQAEEFKPKIDLSHISKPGDVLKAITQKAAQPIVSPRPSTAQPQRRRARPWLRRRLCLRVLPAALPNRRRSLPVLRRSFRWKLPSPHRASLHRSRWPVRRPQLPSLRSRRRLPQSLMRQLSRKKLEPKIRFQSRFTPSPKW